MKVTDNPEETLRFGDYANSMAESLDVRAIPVKSESSEGGACHNPCNIEKRTPYQQS